MRPAIINQPSADLKTDNLMLSLEDCTMLEDFARAEERNPSPRKKINETGASKRAVASGALLAAKVMASQFCAILVKQRLRRSSGLVSLSNRTSIEHQR